MTSLEETLVYKAVEFMLGSVMKQIINFHLKGKELHFEDNYVEIKYEFMYAWKQSILLEARMA